MADNEKALKLHEEWQGKIETVSKCPIKTREDLALAYTPGVAEPCKVIAENKDAAYTYTSKANTVAVVSDGSAVLGLGNIGAYAAIPVMEGKAALFKEFGNVNAVPICLDTQDPDKVIEAVRLLAPVFGGINLEDISSPNCFYIEETLEKELDISSYSTNDKRVFGFVSERLLDAWLITNNIAYEELDVVYMESQHWLRKGMAFLNRKFFPHKEAHK